MPGNLRYSSGSGGPQKPHSMPSRTMSLDCLHDRGSMLDQKIQEYLPTRVTRTTPKINGAAMQFVKVGPASLHKSATEQIKKAELSKEKRKNLEEVEVDWQKPSSSPSSSNPYDEGSDWQSNLDKWKSSRRKRNEDALERVIEIKKNEQEEEISKMRRKSKTFSEMREDKTKRGRRYNLVVHNDDNNDLAGLGLSGTSGPSEDTPGDTNPGTKEDLIIDQDNKDAKSDAGFCTGSDTGSDGVFAEDNISDTSSALGDKKEAHDSLLDTGIIKEDEHPHINGHSSTSLVTEQFTTTSSSTTIVQTSSSSHQTDEYTYDKAIAGYKQYAENSAKKRTSSITSLNSNTSYTKEEERKEERFGVTNRSPSPNKGKKLEGMVNFFSKELDQEKTNPEPRVVRREKSPKVDVGKRRSMFESRESSSEREQRQANRRSLDMSGSLKNRVASFENLDTETTGSSRVRGVTPTRDPNLRMKVASFERLDNDTAKYKGVTPPRDTKFQDKLASFSTSDVESQQIKKKTPERDVNFHKKLASFTSMEEERETIERTKTIPQGDPTLKSKIASFKQMEQMAETQSHHSSKQQEGSPNREDQMQYRDRSISLENLDEPPSEAKLRPSVSMGSILRRTPSTPYMVVDLEESRNETQCEAEVRSVVSFAAKLDANSNPDVDVKRSTVYETVEKCQVMRDVESAPLYSIFQYLSPEVGGEDLSGDITDDHHYQTLEEVRAEVVEPPRALPTPPSPPPPLIQPPLPQSTFNSTPLAPAPLPPTILNQSPINSPLAKSPLAPIPPVKEQPPLFSAPLLPPEPVVPEVLDVTWTDSGPSQAAPPSEPPPPPPPDDDDEGESDLCLGKDDHEQEEAQDGFTRENSTRRLKKEIYRRMSNFLGTSSNYIEEETAVKPPPGLSDILRQEKEAERNMCGGRSPTQVVLMEAEIARREREIIEDVERSEQLKQQMVPQTPSVVSDVETENSDKTEYEEHMQYQESHSLQDSRLSTNSPHFNSHSDLKNANSLSQFESKNVDYPPQFTQDTVDSQFTTVEDFLQFKTVNVVSEEKQTNASDEHKISYNLVQSSYETIENSVRIEEKHTEVMEKNIVETGETHSETECELSKPRLRNQAKVSPRPASLPVLSAGSQPEEYKKLAELEEEMLRHDQQMLRRSGLLPPTSQSTAPAANNTSLHNATQINTHTTSTHSTSQQSTHKHLPIQEFYTAPAYESTPPASISESGFRAEEHVYSVEEQSGYRTEQQVSGYMIEEQRTAFRNEEQTSNSHYASLASPHPYSRSNSQSALDTTATSAHNSLQAARSSPASGPEPLPRRKKAPLPAPPKPQHRPTDLNTAERKEAMRVSRMTSNEPQMNEMGDSEEVTGGSGQQMSKQTLLALSAIPKPRLTENESWIKKKAEAQKRDYSKHWLHQEAEQRRMEQDRISRPKFSPQSSSSPPQPAPQQLPSPSQQYPSSKPFHPQNATPIYPPPASTPVFSTYPQALKNPSPIHQNNNNTNNNVVTNNNNNNSWRNQATTYQPHIPTPAPTTDKALPDAIIHNLTQRVNNKNKGSFNSGGRLSSNSNSSSYSGGPRDDTNYHDYMNTDALNTSTTTTVSPGHSPLYQAASTPSPSTPQPPTPQTQDQSTSAQDQRLLSVSGKKKCSHCSEELGRGAAMIIESLRLFYHIPCFKCCVCGIQLGNGSAGADVRVRNHKLHCHNCYSNDEGMKFSKV